MMIDVGKLGQAEARRTMPVFCFVVRECVKWREGVATVDVEGFHLVSGDVLLWR